MFTANSSGNKASTSRTMCLGIFRVLMGSEAPAGDNELYNPNIPF